MRTLIVTADDFGLTTGINEAVEQAYNQGILTSASLMVNAPEVRDAVQRARRMSNLGVGLHVVVVEGVPTLPAHEIPELTGPDGRFSDDLFSAGVSYFFNSSARHQLLAEVRAQFAAFHSFGLALDHVNAHNHMHLHPVVFSIIADLAKEYGNVPVRIPYEPPLKSWRSAGHGLARRIFTTLGLWPWLALMRMRIKSRGLVANNCVFGLHDTGQLDESLLLEILKHLPAGLTELYMHPATHRNTTLEKAMPNYRNSEEFNALLSSRVRAAIDIYDIHLGTFSSFAKLQAGC